MNTESEIWKIITDFPDYQISNYGRVKSFKYDKTNGKILKKIINGEKYFCINLYGNKRETKNIHVLIYETFYNDKLKSNENIHHKDENKENNYYENLEKLIKSS